MPLRLIDCLGATEELAELFSDHSVLDAMLRFETALALAQARIGVIPQSAADSISKAAIVDGFDAAALAREARASATVAVPLVNALTARVREIDERSAGFVHWGATSQDVVDTAFILLLGRARQILSRDHHRLNAALRSLSDRHAGTVMLARTLMQPAPPITFGYKVAGWFGAVQRSWRRLAQSFADTLQLQFGGASGTLASYGDQGIALASELGKELNLPVPAAPWHTHRDRLAGLVTACGIYTGNLGKIARDVTLLMQHEVGEVSESGGGSSAMPHKRNPAGSVIALASAMRVPGLVGTYLSLMIQEHERAAGGWQAEWQTIAEVIGATGSALAAVADLIEHLEVHPDRMRVNLESTHGAVLSEKAVMMLAEKMGRPAAQKLMSGALRKAAESGEPLEDVLPVSLGGPEDYLGAAERFRRQLLKDSE